MVLTLTRDQILGFRRRAGALDERLPPGAESLRRAAWAGLQDSMPRAALLSIHARVQGAEPSAWEDPSLVQIWGPRYQVYAVAAQDVGIFSLGRMPEGGSGRRRAEELAARLHEHLDGRRSRYDDAGVAIGVHANSLRYGAATGTVLIRWEGARRPVVWTVPPPEIDPAEARRELARRYLHVFGPCSSADYARWAGISKAAGAAAFRSVAASVTGVRTPIGEGWILTEDEPLFRAEPRPAAGARLLPSGDAYFLLWGDQRALLVPDPDHRGALWTSRVWPGAVLLDGEVCGTWRRAHDTLTVHTWHAPSEAVRQAVEAEAEGLPLPGIEGRVAVRWGELV
jgi:hypothetical protein